MAVCVLGSGSQHVLLHRPLPYTNAAVPSIARTSNLPRLTTAILTSKTLPKPPPSDSPLSVEPRQPQSQPYSRRRAAAIIDIQQSSDLDSALSRSGRILKVQDLNVILGYYGNLERWHDLTQLFEWMQKHGKISMSSYRSYIKFMGINHNPAKAVEIYNSIGDESIRSHVSVCNSVLSSLVKNGKFDSSMKLFNQMKRDGVRPDVVTYSTLLTGCMKINHGYSRALELVQELEQNDLHMDSVMYGTLLAVCASHNRPTEAENYFQQMMKEGHVPNEFHYSSLLNAYSVNGDYKKADELVENLKSSGLLPNKVIMTTLLKVYVKGGLFEKSKVLLSELELLGYAQDEMPYCLLMDALSKAGHITEAELVFDEMREKNVRSEGYAHSIMISAFCRAESFGKAKQLAKDFEAGFNKYDLVMLNTMLCAFCRAGEMKSVMQMMKRMDDLSISPDWKTFHILIKYFCKEKLYLLAYRIIADMFRKGHQPDEEICSSLIIDLGKTGAYSEAYSVYNMLRYQKKPMCKDLHESILLILVRGRLLRDAYVVTKDNAGLISQRAIRKFANAFMKYGNTNLINDVLKVLHSSSYKIDQELFHIVISRYIAESEKKGLLLQLLAWMPGQGYIVDSSARNLILKNSHLYGRQIIAELLSKQYKILKALR